MVELSTPKVAIVTAASRGIGAACANAFASQDWRVVLMARSQTVVAQGANLGGMGMQGSVAEPGDLERLVEITKKRFGRIDAVVNNTGHPVSSDLLAISDDEWHRNLDLILLNVVRMARLVTPIMTEQGGGSLINISAADAFEPDLRFALTSTYRAALGAWTKLYADRYGGSGIRMNAVLPGIVLPDGDDAANAEVSRRVPLNRAASYAEIAAVVLHLASDAASYVTGQNIRVDGGMSRSV